MDTVSGDLQRTARKYMEDLAWTREKSEGGGDILIRACFKGLREDRMMMVKAKESVNTPMAQLVEIALEEERHKVKTGSKKLLKKDDIEARENDTYHREIMSQESHY